MSKTHAVYSIAITDCVLHGEVTAACSVSLIFSKICCYASFIISST